MGYFKVIVEERFMFEVLIKADTAEEAKRNVLNNDDDWGEPIHIDSQTYKVTELKEIPT
jgi:hypothetical protein